MALYLTKNGEQLGPYTLDEVQALVRSGTVTNTEWAWQEGLPNWIPLNQIPGYVSPPSALPPPPAPVAAPVAYEEYKPVPIKENKPLLQKIGTGIVAIGYAAFKFKALAFGGLKTGLSMLLMIWTYSWLFGWPFAVGIVILIFVHEMGHVIAAKLLGLPVSAPLFIPFIGAAITMKQSPRDAWTEAWMAYGGPLAGCLGSWACLGIALYMDKPWLMAIASVSFVINLFNMIPVPPLDGGRICAAVSPWFWIPGLILLGLSVFYFHAWNSIVIIILVLLVALPRMKQAFFEEPTEEMRLYYATHLSNRLIMALLYLGLIGVLMVGYWDASMHLSYLSETSDDSSN